ncbi:MAG: nitrogenase-stabilizing/protective protein NifW [Chromatiaceae bacterium]|nr:nitrogenase-stabilizing/protective protein NifW [Chromatiaceae bacterium]
MSINEFESELAELSSAEDFLDYFGVVYEPSVVQVNRLHILQRFHDYLDGVGQMPEKDLERRALFAGLLNSAYSDFVQSDARTERVFKVFQVREQVPVEIPLTSLLSPGTTRASEV